MKGISFEDWWNTEPHPEIQVDKASAERIWEAAQRHYQDELRRSLSVYKTLATVANGLRAFLEEHVPGSVFVTANGQWVFKAFCDELDYVKRELGDKQ